MNFQNIQSRKGVEEYNQFQSNSGPGVVSGKKLAIQSPIRAAGTSSLSAENQTPRDDFSSNRPSVSALRPATTFHQPQSMRGNNIERPSNQGPRHSGSIERSCVDSIGVEVFSPFKTLQENPKAFFRKRSEGSLMDFCEQKHNMRNFEGTVHPLRDPMNRQPPVQGYQYSRVNKDVPELSAYDYVDSEVFTRTIGYPVGHVRNNSKLAKDAFGNTRPLTMSSIGSRTSLASMNESVHPSATLHRYDLIQSPKETRFDSFTIRTDWNKQFYKEEQEKKKRLNDKKKFKQLQKEQNKTAMEIRADISSFEDNLKAISSKRVHA